MNNDKNKNFVRNTIGISGVELLWGLGLPVLFESTFLQIFLAKLGASSQVIGLIPAIGPTGVALFSLMSAYLTSHLIHKRKSLIITHIIAGIPLAIYGILLFFTGKSIYSITLFLSMYSLFSLGIGLTLPLWQNYIVSLFTDEKRLPAISIMMITQTVSKLIASFFIFKLVERFSFSTITAGIVFICIGILFMISATFYLFTKETPHKTEGEENEHLKLSTFLIFSKNILKNKNLLFFIFSNGEAFISITIISFYANFSTRYYGINESFAVGFFAGFIYLGAIFANICLGWFNLFNLKTKIIISKTFAIIACLLLLINTRLPGFFIISFLLGISRGVSQLVYSPAIKQLSGERDATTHFAIASIFGLPMSFGVPFLSGFFLDQLSFLKIMSYKLLFLVLTLLLVVSLILIVLTHFRDGGKK